MVQGKLLPIGPTLIRPVMPPLILRQAWTQFFGHGEEKPPLVEQKVQNRMTYLEFDNVSSIVSNPELIKHRIEKE
jgi:hypothetical protein